jgi:hypothetical protein
LYIFVEKLQKAKSSHKQQAGSEKRRKTRAGRLYNQAEARRSKPKTKAKKNANYRNQKTGGNEKKNARGRKEPYRKKTYRVLIIIARKGKKAAGSKKSETSQCTPAVYSPFADAGRALCAQRQPRESIPRECTIPDFEFALKRKPRVYPP